MFLLFISIFIIFLFFICFSLFFKSKKLSQQIEIQNNQLQQLLEKFTVGSEVSNKNQQQLQQQLNFNHQQLANQQTELKTYFERQISD